MLVTAGLLLVPFILLAVASGRAEGLIWFMIPFVAMLPVLFLTSLVLMPVEALAIKYGISANTAVISAGSVLGGGVGVLALYMGRNRTEVISKLLSGDLMTIGAMLGIVLIGALVGTAWRFSWLILNR